MLATNRVEADYLAPPHCNSARIRATRRFPLFDPAFMTNGLFQLEAGDAHRGSLHPRPRGRVSGHTDRVTYARRQRRKPRQQHPLPARPTGTSADDGDRIRSGQRRG